MLTHSRIVERSMERGSLHVGARGRTIVFGTYLDVIVRSGRRRRGLNDVHIGELVTSAPMVDGRELPTGSRNEEDPDGQL